MKSCLVDIKITITFKEIMQSSYHLIWYVKTCLTKSIFQLFRCGSMNLAWLSKPICPRHPGHSCLKILVELAWNYKSIWNLSQFGLKIGQSGMEIWANLIWPGSSGQSGLEIRANLTLKSGLIWPGVLGQYGMEKLGQSGLDIQDNLAQK